MTTGRSIDKKFVTFSWSTTKLPKTHATARGAEPVAQATGSNRGPARRTRGGSRTRGGTGGSNRGPATRTRAPSAVAKISQRHRGPMRLPKNRPPSIARARTSSGGGVRVRASGPILDLQNFRFSIFENFQFFIVCVGATPFGPFGR